MTMISKLLITISVLDRNLENGNISRFNYDIQMANVKGLIQYELMELYNDK